MGKGIEAEKVEVAVAEVVEGESAGEGTALRDNSQWREGGSHRP